MNGIITTHVKSRLDVKRLDKGGQADNCCPFHIAPQQLNQIMGHYWRTLNDNNRSQDAFLISLSQVKKARRIYESIPEAVYLLGTISVTSNELLVFDPYVSSLDSGVSISNVNNGEWQVYVIAEYGVHTALFACHEPNNFLDLRSVDHLMDGGKWLRVGIVPIDTATCAISDRTSARSLDPDKHEFEISGRLDNLIFSNSANADRGYSILARTQFGLVDTVFIDFYYEI